MARILILTGIFLSITVFSSAATITVPGDFAMIQEAIDAATGGDTVLVAPGNYRENIIYYGKAITVMSSHGPYQTTINGRSVTASGISD